MAINFFAVTLALYPVCPPFAALCFTSLSIIVFSPSLFYLRSSPVPFSFSAILFFASPPHFALYPSFHLFLLFLLLLLFSVSFCRLLPPLLPFYIFLPFFTIYLLIFFLNSIPCQRKNSRDFCNLALLLSPHRRFLPLSRSSRDTSLAETSTAFLSVSFFFTCFAFVSLRVPPSQNPIPSDDSSLAVGTVSGVVSHKSLNNSNVASSFPLFFFL